MAEQETARLTGNFEAPVPLARRRAARIPGARKRGGETARRRTNFRGNFARSVATAVQFLVDLCRPSQLTVGPFLRGFYFTGVRPIIINESAPVARRAAAAGGLRTGVRSDGHLPCRRAGAGTGAASRSPVAGHAESPAVAVPQSPVQRRPAGRSRRDGRKQREHQDERRTPVPVRRGRRAVPPAVHRVYGFVLAQSRARSAGAGRRARASRPANRRGPTWLRSTACGSSRRCGSRWRRWRNTGAKARRGATAGACTPATICIPRRGAFISTASNNSCSDRLRETFCSRCEGCPRRRVRNTVRPMTRSRRTSSRPRITIRARSCSSRPC